MCNTDFADTEGVKNLRKIFQTSNVMEATFRNARFLDLYNFSIFAAHWDHSSPYSVMVRDATATAKKSRMTGNVNLLTITFFLVAIAAIDTAGALPTWRRLGFRTGIGVRLSVDLSQLETIRVNS